MIHAKKIFLDILLDNNGNGLMEYISCVFLKTKSQYRPLNVLPNSSKKSFNITIEKMIKKLKLYMDSKILVKDEIIKLIKHKNWNDSNIEIQDIPDEFKLGNWITFLPPLELLNIKRATNISSEFVSLLENNIRKEDYMQFSRLMNLKGKIINNNIDDDYKILYKISLQSTIITIYYR